ncbi:SigE family RNA polymerase sigma factor [Jiangella alkaliphila]|uniref:RNA polymerase sigma-70 factor, sigma-E family n=1 Tax=Jiangella alkaliphila TaxID=419479 RepID=A0A1H2L2I2_9ACTN|nr:SigE family RNA polymerase sigma factor [Jiangella alkaliphila]SDU74801.1 RNA polymerase sigma-70 factor, sigma-E family [Jiangella alkaliphila]
MLAIDEASYGEFVGGRQRALLRTAFLLTGDWHLAEDLVQETLAKLYVAWRRVLRCENAEAYARKTLLNAYIDSTRRPWRRERSVDVVPEQAGAGDPADGTDPGARGQLLAALAGLPAGRRAVLVLRFWEDQSVEQVADLLGCSTGNVKSQTSRGLQQLRDVLGPQMLATIEEQR